MNTETISLPRQLIVTVDGSTNIANVTRAIRMLRGVTAIRPAKAKTKKPRLYDPETGEYLNDETIKVIEDAHKGIGVTHYDSLQDFYKEMGL